MPKLRRPSIVLPLVEAESGWFLRVKAGCGRGGSQKTLERPCMLLDPIAGYLRRRQTDLADVLRSVCVVVRMSPMRRVMLDQR
jgi:hypothetical protein